MSSDGTDQTPLVQVDELAVRFDVSARNWGLSSRVLRAVDGISFEVAKGESLALVGESGSGKTTTGRAILGLYRPASGSVRFDGEEVSRLSGPALRRFRRRAQMIFQDPYAFSGGQRQRIGIARALALSPDFVVADEPVSALDVSVQAQILNLLAQLRDELSLTMVFIAHNLAVVRHVASRVAVMYLGELVEIGTRDEVFSRPAHPYTRALLRAVPPPDPAAGWSGAEVSLRGDVPSPVDPPQGCRFHTRCPEAIEICKTVVPKVQTFPSGRKVACHLASPEQYDADPNDTGSARRP